MILAFADVEIDPGKAELRRNNQPVRTAPRVRSLIYLLASNSDRIVTKDEIIEKVWDGRIISDSAISTSIKEARQAVGDDGTRQEIIRTVHGQGFRCIAEVRLVAPTERVATAANLIAPDDQTANNLLAGKPSIAVLPFYNVTAENDSDPFGYGLAAELISALSRLGFLSVTARGSSFRFRQRDPDLDAIGKLLKVRYCLSGIVEKSGTEIAVTVELARTSDGRVMWSDRFAGAVEHIHDARRHIVGEVVAALDVHIPFSEAQAARLSVPDRLDAWAQYHIGLQHLYRFNVHDNARARERFQSAISSEPGFARAHAGLSFVEFQSAFMAYQPDPQTHIREAVTHAEKSLELDLLDPFGNYCMGRAKWVDGNLDEADNWLCRSLEISPNYAQAHYLRALVRVMQGESRSAHDGTSLAMALSPLDPLQYAMLATQAMAYIIDERFEEAAVWADRAVNSPGCHYLPVMVAAAAQQLKGDRARARHWADYTRSRRPDVTIERFFQAFPYQRDSDRRLWIRALSGAGFRQ